MSKMNSTSNRYKLIEADAVCLDVDSTVCTDEAIDELAYFCGVGSQVKQWTEKAMGGGVTFRESLVARLDIMRPSRQIVEKFITEHKPSLTPGVKEFISLLTESGVHVYLITGGFQDIVLPVAEAVNVPSHRVYSNNFTFDQTGSFSGFDMSRLTSDSGGKARVCDLLKQTYKCLVMIGDGATDLEASPPADYFIGFGGNQVRENVKAKAPWFVTSFQELINYYKRERYSGNCDNGTS